MDLLACGQHGLTRQTDLDGESLPLARMRTIFLLEDIVSTRMKQLTFVQIGECTDAVCMEKQRCAKRATYTDF